MEYIPGEYIEDAVPVMDKKERVALVCTSCSRHTSVSPVLTSIVHFQIKSARHIVCALQYVDVAQYDLHSKQVLVLRTPTGTPVTVHYDFSQTAVSVEPENNARADYGDMLTRVLEKPLRSSGMTGKVLLHHYGKPEIWDCLGSGGMRGDRDGESLWFDAEDPYEWVYESGVEKRLTIYRPPVQATPQIYGS